jgi:CD36 family
MGCRPAPDTVTMCIETSRQKDISALTVRTNLQGQTPTALLEGKERPTTWAPSQTPALHREISLAGYRDRCAYPSNIHGTWNASLTYGCPTLMTLPHFYRANSELAEAVNAASFAPDPAKHDWTYDFEPTFGFPLAVSVPIHSLQRWDL